MQKHVNLVDVVKSFPTTIYYFIYMYSLAKFGFDTAEKDSLKACFICSLFPFKLVSFNVY